LKTFSCAVIDGSAIKMRPELKANGRTVAAMLPAKHQSEKCVGPFLRNGLDDRVVLGGGACYEEFDGVANPGRHYL
jgi:hypothetical protein